MFLASTYLEHNVVVTATVKSNSLTCYISFIENVLQKVSN